jgi:hypothetical protein
MGAKSTGEFVRLFMVPGMQHCAGGAGPNAFGQGGVAQGDARSNISAALERWVEQGVAPEELIATKNKSAANPVVRTRPLCAYPKVAIYKGTGRPRCGELQVVPGSRRRARRTRPGPVRHGSTSPRHLRDRSPLPPGSPLNLPTPSTSYAIMNVPTIVWRGYRQSRRRIVRALRNGPGKRSFATAPR